MQAEHLQYWMEAATREERPYTANWDRVVDIIQTYFWYGRLLTECMWQMVVLIPKGNGGFRGNGILEVLWKALLRVINRRIRAAVKFHGVLHGFWVGWGMGTASLETKLLQQLTDMREEVLYKVFLNLRKAYDELDRERCMEILMGYGVGPRTERILRQYWDHLSMVARAG